MTRLWLTKDSDGNFPSLANVILVTEEVQKGGFKGNTD